MVSTQYIDNIISIVKLNIREVEKESLVEDVENILKYVEVLNDIDVDNSIFVDNINLETEILRDDKVDISFDRENIQKNAPSVKDGYFLVPNILVD